MGRPCRRKNLVPIAALKSNVAVDHMEEPATSQPVGVPPLKDRPLPLFEDVLNDAVHFCRGKSGREHLANILSALDRRLSNLMVHGVLTIEGRQRFHVGAVKRLHPRLNQLPRLHACALTSAVERPRRSALRTTRAHTVPRPPRRQTASASRPPPMLGRTARSGAYHAYHDANNRRPECKPKQYAGSDRVWVRIRPQPQRGRRDDE